MKKILLSVALAISAAAVSAAMKVGTVNMVDLVKLHPNHESNLRLIKTSDSDYKAKLDAQQDALRAIADEGKKAQDEMMNPMLSASAKAAAQKKMEGIQQRFMAAQRDLQAAAQRYQVDLADLEGRLLKMETQDIREKIDAYAKANNYDLIVDSTMMAFAKESLDVTDEILKAMNVDPAKRAELKKGAGFAATESEKK